MVIKVFNEEFRGPGTTKRPADELEGAGRGKMAAEGKGRSSDTKIGRWTVRRQAKRIRY